MHCANPRRVNRFFAVGLILTISLTSAHSQTARNADLTRIRAEIARLRDRLNDVHTQMRSAETEK